MWDRSHFPMVVLLCPRGAPPPYALLQGFYLSSWKLVSTSYKLLEGGLFLSLLGLLLVTQNVLYQVGT